MKFKCTPEQINKIREHEERVLFKYKQIADRCKEKFIKYQCSIKLEMKWYNCMSIKQKVFDYRIPLKNGYVCFIDFSVQQNGKDIKLKSNDGEVDYYLLGDSSNITEITWLLVCKKINLFSDTEDFEKELHYYLEMLENYHTC